MPGQNQLKQFCLGNPSLCPDQFTSASLGERVIEDGTRAKFRGKQNNIMVRVKRGFVVFRDKNPATSAMIVPIISGCLLIGESEVLIHLKAY